MDTKNTVNTTGTIRTYRFKYTPDFQQRLSEFAIKHADKPKKEFDACFKNWCSINQQHVDNEYETLVNQGYNRDFQHRMYLSVRYYFRNKQNKQNKNDNDNDNDNADNMMNRSGKQVRCKSDKKKTKLKYVRMADELKTLMKQHIYDNMGVNKSPKEMFGLFHNSANEEIRRFLKSEKTKLQENGYSDKDVLFRIKKTYKNQYFVALRKSKSQINNKQND